MHMHTLLSPFVLEFVGSKPSVEVNVACCNDRACVQLLLEGGLGLGFGEPTPSTAAVLEECRYAGVASHGQEATAS